MVRGSRHKKRKRELIHIRTWWLNHQWPIIGGIILFSLVLGYIGFSKHSGILGESRTPLDIIYLTLQLFVFESGSVTGPVPWELEIARLLLPVLAAYTAMKALAVIFKQQLQLLRLRFMKNHIIICGLGQKGALITQKFRGKGERVVAIELNEGNDMISLCRDSGAFVLHGDARESEILRKARVHKATWLISVCGDDGINAEIAVQTHELCQNRRGRALTCIVHIADPQLCHLIKEKELVGSRTNNFRLEFLNIYEKGARAWTKKNFSIDKYLINAEIKPLLLIIFWGRMGNNLIVEAARNWKESAYGSDTKLHIMVVDDRAAIKKQSLLAQFPKLEDVCLLTAHQLKWDSHEFQSGKFLEDIRKENAISTIYMCADEDTLNLTTALSLHQRTHVLEIPIFVQMTYSRSLSNVLGTESECVKKPCAFHLMEQTCEPDMLIGGSHETLAHTIHEEYVFKQKEKGQTLEANPALVPWNDLSENLKESNRSQADHIMTKLEAIQCGIIPLSSWDAEKFSFTENEIELMAEMEHKRYVNERISQGWRLGPRNVKKKRSPHLVKWEELEEKTRELDREAVRSIPRTLAKAGFEIFRYKSE